MRISKIICDICKEEIDLDTDEDISLFERIRAQTKMKFKMPTQDTPREMGAKKEIIKSTYDLCKKCGPEIEDFLIKKKEENINNTKVEK